ncbi:MAG: type II toxin-antitoxin system PemK/MazF family toxin, partial [Candidatus Aenigmatarchaeota archaeon]
SDSPEFKSTGLEKDSIIKLDKIFTISKEKIKKIIGEVSDNLKNEINRKLQKILML